MNIFLNKFNLKHTLNILGLFSIYLLYTRLSKTMYGYAMHMHIIIEKKIIFFCTKTFSAETWGDIFFFLHQHPLSQNVKCIYEE